MNGPYILLILPTILVLAFAYYKVLKFSKRYNSGRFSEWLNILIITGILFYLNKLIFYGLTEISDIKYTIAYPIGLTIGMFFAQGVFRLFDNRTLYFMSSESTGKFNIYNNREFKMVSKLDAEKISIYPRISIWNADINDIQHPNHIIFDSSDFLEINKTFGAFENIQESFEVGSHFKFNNTKLLAHKIRVDFLSIYDDYSNGQTDVYQGSKIPYNIQIIVWAKKIPGVTDESIFKTEDE